MICALLVFKSEKFPKALGDISPWFDMRMAPVDQVVEQFEAQTHRRIIKTHTALDGLPYYDNVTYLFCGRSPRDTYVSMQNHGKNQNIPHLMSLLVAQGITPPPPPELPDDINERFRLWLTKPAFPWEEDGYPYWSVFAHTKTFWAFRDLENIHLLHYADLQEDLLGQMKRVAAILNIDIDDQLWPALVDAASFDSMKGNADNIAPDTNHQAWQSNAAFFHKGTNEQWREVLDEKSIALYETVLTKRAPGDLGRWMEKGFINGNVAYP